MDMVKRPRRLRGGETLRRMVRETRMDKASLVYPMFVVEGKGIRHEIPSMPGQYHYRDVYKRQLPESPGRNPLHGYEIRRFLLYRHGL